MRRKDRELPPEEVLQVLKDGEYGILATLGEDGFPYGLPLSYAYDDEKKCIYLHGTSQACTYASNAAAHPKVCFTVVGKTKVQPEQFSTLYSSVIAFGMMRKLENDEEKKNGLLDLVEKYSPDYLEEGKKYIDRALNQVAVYAIENLVVTGKAKKK